MANITYEQFEHVLNNVKLERNKELRRLNSKSFSPVEAIYDIMLEKLSSTIRLRDDDEDYVTFADASKVFLDGLITLNYLITMKGLSGDPV